LPGGALNEWQEQWCTPETVAIYLRGRMGDPGRAGEILARALDWRERYRHILTEAKQPKWNGDLRVVARGQDGHPVIYLCMRNAPPFSEKVAVIEHAAAVFEAAVRLMENSANQIDVVVDCHGFSLINAPNPALLLDFLDMLKDPYRDRLRRVLVVEAPAAIGALWKVAKRVLPKATLRKVLWVNSTQLDTELERNSGPPVVEAVRRAMACNRNTSKADTCKMRFPSEVS
jgi:hypothetical protein